MGALRRRRGLHRQYLQPGGGRGAHGGRVRDDDLSAPAGQQLPRPCARRCNGTSMLWGRPATLPLSPGRIRPSAARGSRSSTPGAYCPAEVHQSRRAASGCPRPPRRRVPAAAATPPRPRPAPSSDVSSSDTSSSRPANRAADRSPAPLPGVFTQYTDTMDFPRDELVRQDFLADGDERTRADQSGGGDVSRTMTSFVCSSSPRSSSSGTPW